MKKLFLLLALAGCVSVQSQTISSVQSGDWSDPTTWSSNPLLPDDGDAILISSGHTVTIDGTPDITLDGVTLIIDGILEMTDDGLAEANLELTGYSGILLNGQIMDNVSGGLNPNEGESVILVDGEVVWTACDGNGLSDPVCFAVYETNYLLVDPEPDNYSDQDGTGTPILMPATNNPLPVTLVLFEARPESKACLLTWSTSSELNNDHFSIERSENGFDFYKVGSVLGHGTTSEPHEYSFKDYSPKSAIEYYKLTQFDQDGTSASLGVRVVHFGQSELNEEKIYPNPVSDVVFITPVQGSAIIGVKLIHASGKTLWDLTRYMESSGNDLKIKLPILSRGSYFLEYVTQEGKKGVRKLLVE